MKSKYKRNVRRNKNATLGIVSILIIVIAIIGIFIFASPNIKDLLMRVNSPYAFLFDINQNANASISNYYIYGTHFNLEGNLQLDINSAVEDAKVVFRNESGDEIEYSLIYDVVENKINFSTSEKINTGIDLEELKVGNYYTLLKITYAKDENTKVISEKKKDEDTYDNIKYYSFSDNSDDLAMTYYTITKNNLNNKIDIGFEAIQVDQSNFSVMTVKSKESKLDDGIYDIVIDAGHGGADGGTVNGEYTEAKIVLDIALELKSRLEDLGLKVKLTRDGTEANTVQMAYTMYDEDGRVNIAGDSKAKLCISLHLNSFDGNLAQGGLQIYCPYNIDTTFASLLSDEIIDKANTYASTMEAHSIGEGIYCRTFDDNDISYNIDVAKKDGFEPYKVDNTINYYYIIRELGGEVTGAYVDGRNQKYGKNNYFDSNIGIETYLVELGYITDAKDLKNLIENKDGYINGIVNAISKQFSLSK